MKDWHGFGTSIMLRYASTKTSTTPRSLRGALGLRSYVSVRVFCTLESKHFVPLAGFEPLFWKFQARYQAMRFCIRPHSFPALTYLSEGPQNQVSTELLFAEPLPSPLMCTFENERLWLRYKSYAKLHLRSYVCTLLAFPKSLLQSKSPT